MRTGLAGAAARALEQEIISASMQSQVRTIATRLPPNGGRASRLLSPGRELRLVRELLRP
jgi:hypothetical protein